MLWYVINTLTWLNRNKLAAIVLGSHAKRKHGVRKSWCWNNTMEWHIDLQTTLVIKGQITVLQCTTI